MSRSIPSYRNRTGSNQAMVTFSDAKTKMRRDYWLGNYDSPESREKYFRLLAEWESNGHTLPAAAEDLPLDPKHQATISEIVMAYWKYGESYYQRQEMQCLRVVLRLLRKYFGGMAAVEFGPMKLRSLRERMIAGDPHAQPPRIPWSRKYINHQIKRICRMFKWAVSREMIPVEVHQQLVTIEPLKRGRSGARETIAVKPVAIEKIDAIRPYVSRQVAALIDLQLLTGARGGELFKLRANDLNMSDDSGLWTYTPAEHKTAYREKERTIIFGPKAQEVIRPFLQDRPIGAYLFSPAQADAERRAKLTAQRKTRPSCGNTVGSNRHARPQKQPGEHYTAGSYAYAIYLACDHAFELPEDLRPQKRQKDDKLETKVQWWQRLTDAQKKEVKAWRKAHRWHPHQLRHLAGTILRRQFGLEVAQIVLGHSSAQITDAVYAERDLNKLNEAMKQVG